MKQNPKLYYPHKNKSFKLFPAVNASLKNETNLHRTVALGGVLPLIFFFFFQKGYEI